MSRYKSTVPQLKHIARIMIGSIFSLFFCGLALADEWEDVHPFLSDTFIVELGVYSPRRDIKIRVDGSIGGDNGSIDFGDELGVKKRDDIFAAEFIWRFGEKWSLHTEFFSESASKSAVLLDDIEWGDTVIQAGSSVTAGTNLSMTRIFFGRSFDSNPKYDYGVGLGLHWLETGAFIERDIITNFGEASAVSASGPLPNIGGWYYYSPSSKWVVGGRLDWLEASLGDYAGGILNFAAGASYQLTDHFGVGAKYHVFELNVDVKKSDFWRGRLNTEFKGTFLYLSGNW